jgi:chaperone BCS1
MVPPPVRRLAALMRSLLGGLTTNTIRELFGQSTPSFGFLQSFFAAWLKLDLTTLASILTIFGTLTNAWRALQGVTLKIYWWFTRFFTASISIAGSDRLNREILNWLGSEILMPKGTRILTARTETIQNDAWYPRRHVEEKDEFHLDKRVPIKYLPTFGTTWFIFNYTVFMVQRIPLNGSSALANHAMGIPNEYAAAPIGDEPLVVMCLGRSVEPIKKFLDHCRDFAEKQRESFITVRASKQRYGNESWDSTILRPIRPLETVHFDETTKYELAADIKNYLDPATRRFYTDRGIPYRRGYLLHGPPGTGKTSLSLALAGTFGLELYLVHLPSVREDSELERLFTALPRRCLVLLEDIDAVGTKRKPEMVEEDDDGDDSDEEEAPIRSRVTLSGLLNVLDGVASQEGRIVLMTSNMAHKLDDALIRPGRIDKMIFLGNISQRSAELMFLRMYTPDKTHALRSISRDLKEGELQRLALQFSNQIPDDAFTPAQLQGYLLNRRNSPSAAAAETSEWVSEQIAKKEEAKSRAKRAAEWRAKKRQKAAMKLLAKNLKESGIEAEELAVTGKEKTIGEPTKTEEERQATKVEDKEAGGKEDTDEVEKPIDEPVEKTEEKTKEDAGEGDNIDSSVNKDDEKTKEDTFEGEELIDDTVDKGEEQTEKKADIVEREPEHKV